MNRFKKFISRKKIAASASTPNLAYDEDEVEDLEESEINRNSQFMRQLFYLNLKLSFQ